jgi:hypothetical protein|uniref:Uncharacterized protein n=1 Tax=viral metagenome TaxID=1070528 RepID=A0A6C0IKM4_9ZZZZ
MYSFIIEMKFSLKNVLQFQPLLKSQLVLYMFLFIALFEIVHFGTNQNVNGVLLMFLIGFLTSFFSKNMIIILFSAIVFTNLIVYGSQLKYREGFDKKDEVIKRVKKTKKSEEELEEEDSKKEMTKKDIEEQFSSLQKELPEFQKIQFEILDNLEKMDPLLEKAESFINKYSEYRDSNRR